MQTATIRVSAGGREYSTETEAHLAAALRDLVLKRSAAGKTTPIQLQIMGVENGAPRAFKAWIAIGPSSNMVIEFPNDFSFNAGTASVMGEMERMCEEGFTVEIGDTRDAAVFGGNT